MPEVLKETEPQQGQASNADLCRMTLEHYEKVSRAAHEWNSAIPKAIDAYYADPEHARLERLVIEAAKQWRAGNWPAGKVNEAVDSLNNFESQQKQ